jgi:hypothetical protein
MEHKIMTKFDKLFGYVASYGVGLVFAIFSGIMAYKFGVEWWEKGIWICATSFLEMSAWYLMPRVKRAWKDRKEPDPSRKGEVQIHFWERYRKSTPELGRPYTRGFRKGFIMLLACVGIQMFSLVGALIFSINSINTAVESAKTQSSALNVSVDTTGETNQINNAQKTIDTNNGTIAAQNALLANPSLHLEDWERAKAQKQIVDANTSISIAQAEQKSAQTAKDNKTKASSNTSVNTQAKISDSFDQVANFLKPVIPGVTGPNLIVGLFLFAFIFLQVVMWSTWPPLPKEQVRLADAENEAEHNEVNSEIPVETKDFTRSFLWPELEKYLQAALPITGDRMISDDKVSKLTGLSLGRCEYFKKILKTTNYMGKPLIISRPGLTKTMFSKEGMLKIGKFLSNVSTVPDTDESDQSDQEVLT